MPKPRAEIAENNQPVIHIHAPPAERCYLSRQRCTRSHRRARVLVLTFEWYAPLCTCLSCGEEWTGGESLPRPFQPRWREKSIRSSWRFWGRWMRTRRGERKEKGSC